MSTTAEVKTFLATLDQPQNDTDLLRQTLAEMHERQPNLFIDYVVNEGLEAIDSDPLDWNEGYFSRQKKYAEHNFSLTRLEHLLEVREHGRRKGWKGFFTRSMPVAEPQRQPDNFGHSPSNILVKYIREKNMLGIRTALRMELFDRKLDGGALRTALNWVKKQIPNLCEPYIEKDFSGPMDQSRDNWNKDYFFTQEVYLDTSFTEERFLHMIEVREHLRQRGVEGFVPEKPRLKPQVVTSDVSSHPSSQAKHANHTSSRADKERLPPPHEHSDFIKKALLIGGAIAALVVLLLALR